jgi:hypothetical protein
MCQHVIKSTAWRNNPFLGAGENWKRKERGDVSCRAWRRAIRKVTCHQSGRSRMSVVFIGRRAMPPRCFPTSSSKVTTARLSHDPYVTAQKLFTTQGVKLKCQGDRLSARRARRFPENAPKALCKCARSFSCGRLVKGQLIRAARRVKSLKTSTAAALLEAGLLAGRGGRAKAVRGGWVVAAEWPGGRAGGGGGMSRTKS